MNTLLPFRSRPMSRRAFTLLELLVVIAVVGILASLLLASLSLGRESGQRTACRNHLRQWAVALTLYAGDYRDVLPPGQLPGRKIDYLPLVYTNTSSALVHYGGSSNILDCPNLHSILTRSNDWRWPFQQYSLQLGYLYLGGRQSSPWPVAGPPVTNLWNSPQRLTDNPQWKVAADLTYVAPCIGRVVIPHGRTGFVNPRPSLPESDLAGYSSLAQSVLGGANSASLDGSVEWRGKRQVRWYRGALEGPQDNRVCMALW